jgi:glycosyltransferase involved in cell wall biosynthesis
VPELLVSVVVCTRDRPQRLARLLSALRAQDLPAAAFEVIVVLDGPTPHTLSVLAHERELGLSCIRVVELTQARGPGAARNAGWRAAHGPLIAFTDDDCAPAPGWLSGLVAACRPHAFVQGTTRPDPGELTGSGVLSRTITSDTLGPQYETCNIAYPREALNALGGFDEGFGLAPGGEDTDLAWRAIAAGWNPRLAPEAVVFHAVHRLDVRSSLRVAARWSATVRIFSQHPGTRSMLYHGIFWNVWHYLLWRSLLALVGPAWLRRWLLTRHLLELRRRARVAGSGAWAVPFLLMHDAVECWAIARGAKRYRTFVL